MITVQHTINVQNNTYMHAGFKETPNIAEKKMSKK